MNTPKTAALVKRRGAVFGPAENLELKVAELANIIRILLLELDHSYGGLETLPKQHSAVEAAVKAEAILKT